MTELLNSNKATTTSTTANSDPTTTTTNINSNNNTSAGLFHQSKQFLNGIQALNSHNDESRVVRLFVRVCAKAANVDAPEEEKSADALQGGIEEAVLEEILDRVAYTPARPNQMKVSCFTKVEKSDQKSDIPAVDLNFFRLFICFELFLL